MEDRRTDKPAIDDSGKKSRRKMKLGKVPESSEATMELFIEMEGRGEEWTFGLVILAGFMVITSTSSTKVKTCKSGVKGNNIMVISSMRILEMYEFLIKEC